MEGSAKASCLRAVSCTSVGWSLTTCRYRAQFPVADKGARTDRGEEFEPRFLQGGRRLEVRCVTGSLACLSRSACLAVAFAASQLQRLQQAPSSRFCRKVEHHGSSCRTNGQ